MVKVPFSQARSRLTDIVNEVAYGGKKIVLTRKGKTVVAIISIEDFLLLEKIKLGMKN